jgi:phosphoketolase
MSFLIFGKCSLFYFLGSFLLIVVSYSRNSNMYIICLLMVHRWGEGNPPIPYVLSTGTSWTWSDAHNYFSHASMEAIHPIIKSTRSIIYRILSMEHNFCSSCSLSFHFFIGLKSMFAMLSIQVIHLERSPSFVD